MTRDEIIRMAREAGIETVLPAPLGQIESLERFANLVADAVDHREPATTYAAKIKQHFGLKP